MTPSFVEWASPVGNDMIITRNKAGSFDCDGDNDDYDQGIGKEGYSL